MFSEDFAVTKWLVAGAILLCNSQVGAARYFCSAEYGAYLNSRDPTVNWAKETDVRRFIVDSELGIQDLGVTGEVARYEGGCFVPPQDLNGSRVLLRCRWDEGESGVVLALDNQGLVDFTWVVQSYFYVNSRTGSCREIE